MTFAREIITTAQCSNYKTSDLLTAHDCVNYFFCRQFVTPYQCVWSDVTSNEKVLHRYNIWCVIRILIFNRFYADTIVTKFPINRKIISECA